MQSNTPNPPGGPGPIKRRLLQGRELPPTGAGQTPLELRLDEMFSSYRRAVEEQLDQGLRGIEQTAVALMQEIAAEMWRTAGGDAEDAQARILSFLSRDEAIRGLIAHSDERFQSLSVRTSRLEDTLTNLANSTRGLKGAMNDGAKALKESMGRGAETLNEAVATVSEAVGTVQDVDIIRERIQAAEEQLASALERLEAREQAVVENLREQIHDHGQLVHRETGRIVEALEGYVKGGLDVMGHLAQRIDEQTERFGARAGDITQQFDVKATDLAQQFDVKATDLAQQFDAAAGGIAERVTEIVTDQVRAMNDRIEQETRTLSEAFAAHEAWILRTFEASSAHFDSGLAASSAHLDEQLAASASRFDAQLQAQVERVREASRSTAQELVKTFEARLYGLARLVRSDSQALRKQLYEVTASQNEELARELDGRLTGVTDAVGNTTRWAVGEVVRQIGEQTERALKTRIEEVVGSLDRNVMRLTDTLDSEMDRQGQVVGQRVTAAVETAIGTSFDQALARLDRAVEGAERVDAAVGHIDAAAERVDAAVGYVDAATGRMEDVIQSAIANGMEQNMQALVSRAVDDRLVALARMIRSDNRAMAERLQAIAEQEPAKQALRATKELQASLPRDVAEQVDRRFAELANRLQKETQMTAEAVARAAETLGERVERATAAVGRKRDGEFNQAIARLGDAMQALATAGHGSTSDRIELE